MNQSMFSPPPSYLPLHRIGADFIRLSRHFSPEGFDCVLVRFRKTGHLAFVCLNAAMRPNRGGGFYA